MKKINSLKIAFICILLASSSILVFTPESTAHTPPWEIPTYAFITVSPNPAGVGQQVAVVVWLDKMPDGTSVTNNIRFHNYKVEITAPDGLKDTLTWETVYDTTSSAYNTYTPDQIGTYTFNFTFPGQKYTDYTHNPNSAFVNDTYLPSSAVTTLTVQEEPAGGPEITPFPTEYWSRPIEGQNANWFAIGSNYLNPMGAAYSFGSVRLQPDGTAPDSSHVMWSKPITFGGTVGGNNQPQLPNSPTAPTGVEGAAFYTGLSYETKFNNPIIISGRLYYGLPHSNNGAGGGYICVDLRTGQELWRQDYNVNPSFGAVINVETPNQHGAISYLIATQGSTWMMYDPWDGTWVFNITNVPSGTRSYGPYGEPIIYQMNLANKWLALWNFTEVVSNGPVNLLAAAGYRPVNQVFDTTKRQCFSWNVTIPTLPTSGAGIGWAINDDMILGYGNMRSAFGQPTWGGVAEGSTTQYGTVWAICLKENSRGALLWKKDIQVPPGNVTLQLGTVDPTNRMFFVSTKETMQWYGYDLDSGNQKWGPVGKTRAFNYYPTIGSGGVAQIGYVAYSKLYVGGYGGEIFAYDTKTGSVVWSYGGGGEGNSTNSGTESSWGLYPTFVAAIADGKVYVYNNEHSPNVPLYKGEKVRCLNASTGEEIWALDSWAAVGGFGDYGFPIADGQISYLNAYDMQVYSIGRGPSKTTVTAPNVATTVGTPIVIRGTVTDISAGTTQNEQAARFPNGVPAVADESMSTWMEYVYMQKTKPVDAKGVPVNLYVLDQNNNYRHIGTAITDASGMFTYAWEPDIEGSYAISAVFEGTNSYYGSSASSSFYAISAPETVEPTPTPPSMVEQYFIPLMAGLFVIVIVIGAILILLMLRKK